MNYRCDKCGNNVLGTNFFHTLYGQYKAELCLPCFNAWSEFARASDEWKEVTAKCAHECALKSLSRSEPVPEDQWLQLSIREESGKSAMFQLAKRWIADKVVDAEGCDQ